MPPTPDDPAPPHESTARLLVLAQQGDSAARERLARRYFQPLRQFAHGRLPARSRGMIDTDDLVQVTIVRAFQHLNRIEPRGEGAFLAYLRQILINQIRDEARRSVREPVREEFAEALDFGPSPLDEAIGSDTAKAYEEALSQLGQEQREAVIMRIELGLTYQQIAEAQGRSTSNAARMVVVRALVRLAELMRPVRENS